MYMYVYLVFFKIRLYMYHLASGCRILVCEYTCSQGLYSYSIQTNLTLFVYKLASVRV